MRIAKRGLPKARVAATKKPAPKGLPRIMSAGQGGSWVRWGVYPTKAEAMKEKRRTDRSFGKYKLTPMPSPGGGPPFGLYQLFPKGK